MNQENRNKIKANIHFLATNTSSIPVLLNSLFEKEILGDVEIQEINSMSTKYVQLTELYKTLMKKGDNIFENLLLSLEESGNNVCAEKIRNYSPSSINGLIWFNVKPSTTGYYKGRDEDMKTIESYWQESSGKKILFVAVTGLGGIGKSEFATKFAEDFYEKKKGHCIWIDSETNLYNSFQQLASKINIPLEDHAGNETTLQILTHQVYDILLQEKCLFIFDNIENYEETVLTSLVEFTGKLDPTKSRPFIILTSRCKLNHQVFGELGRNLSLDMLSKECALEFFEEALKINRNVNEKAISMAKLVSKKLNYYPLAMQQAVAFIKSQSRCTDDVTTQLESYIVSFENIENNRKTLLEQELPKFQALDNASKTTYLTLKVTLEKIDPRAKDVLDIISFFHSDNIDISFIHQIGVTMFPESEIKSIFESLRNYSLCQKKENKPEVYSVHRIVQHVTQILLDDEKKLVGLLDKLMGIINEILSRKNKIPWNQLTHVEKLWKHASKRKTILEKYTEFPFNIVNQYIDDGRYTEAKEFSIVATKRLESELGEKCRTTLRMKSLRGKAEEKLGESKKILVELKEVYENQKQLTGEDNDVDNRLQTATLIGKLYWRRGKYKKAKNWLTSVLEERQKVINAEKSEATLSLKHDIAVILDVQGKYEDSLKMFQEVLALRKELLPEEHRDILSTLQWIGVVKRHQNKYNEAQITFYDVLHKRSKILGKDHPDTLSTMQNIGMVLDYEAKYPEALIMYNEVLTTQMNVLGKDHRDTLSTLTSIGHVNRHQGNLDEALEKYDQVLQVKLRELGDEHPDSLDAMTNIALAKCQQGDVKKALEIYESVLVIRKRVLGNKHPSTLLTMHNIAGIKDTLGNYKEAIEMYKEVLTLAKGVIGEDDPDTWTTKFNIGIVKYHQGKLKDALQIYEEVKTMRENILGKDHPDTKTTVNSIAHVKKEMETFQFKINGFFRKFIS